MTAGRHTVVMQNAGIFRFPSYRFETHSHAAYEIIYVNAGQGIMGIGEDYVPFKPGICIIVNPYAPTALSWIPRGPVRLPRWR